MPEILPRGVPANPAGKSAQNVFMPKMQVNSFHGGFFWFWGEKLNLEKKPIIKTFFFAVFLFNAS